MFWDGFREKYRDTGLLLFRVVFGFLFLLHALSKFGLISEKSFSTLPFMIQAAGVIELVTGVLLILGLFTTWASFLASGMMAVAYWTVHAVNGSFWNPLANGGELAVVYTFAFLLLWFLGGGAYSLDAKLQT